MPPSGRSAAKAWRIALRSTSKAASTRASSAKLTKATRARGIPAPSRASRKAPAAARAASSRPRAPIEAERSIASTMSAGRRAESQSIAMRHAAVTTSPARMRAGSASAVAATWHGPLGGGGRTMTLGRGKELRPVPARASIH